MPLSLLFASSRFMLCVTLRTKLLCQDFAVHKVYQKPGKWEQPWRSSRSDLGTRNCRVLHSRILLKSYPHPVTMSASTVILLKGDIPEFLRYSPFLQSLIAEEDFPAVGIEVPADCFKANTHVTNVSDLACLLKTVRYWLLPELLVNLEELHSFVLSSKNLNDIIRVLGDFKTELPHVKELLPLVVGNLEEKLVFATGSGFLTLLDTLCQKEKALSHEVGPVDWQRVLRSATAEGKLSCLQYLHAHGHVPDARVTVVAAENGHVDCLAYIINTLEKLGTHVGVEDLFEAAAKGGHISVLRYLHGHFGDPEVICQQSTWCLAARGCHLEVMDFVHEHDFQCEPLDVLGAAVEGGHASMLEFLISTFGAPGEADLQSLWVQAARARQLKVMQYLHAHVSPRDFTQEAHDPYNFILTAAIASGSIPCVAFILELGHTCNDPSYAKYAVEDGFYDLFFFLVEHGCPCVSSECADSCARAGSLVGLRFICKNNLPWSEQTCAAAAAEGHLECLQYLLENGCPVNYDHICENAAEHVDCLTYVHQHGGQLTRAVAIKAAQRGALACLQYLHAHGCVFDVTVANACAENYLSPTCLQFLLDVGCPADRKTRLLEASARARLSLG